MIVISGYTRINPDHREKAIAAAMKMSAESEAEDGCISYRFYGDFEKPDMLFLFEEWESQDALDAHFQTPHMSEFRKALSEIEILEQTLKRYVIESVGDL
ncbi:MAG: putative quinol monooxygenase [Aggregatilineales bacterium]